jgi:hypothetical protein
LRRPLYSSLTFKIEIAHHSALIGFGYWVWIKKPGFGDIGIVKGTVSID